MFKPIPGWEKYKISTSGKILGQYGQEMHPSLLNGYMSVTLSNRGKTRRAQVHRLVAETYIPNPNNLPWVNHINGIKTDNSVENLEWCTPQQNSKHAWAAGLNHPCLGPRDKGSYEPKPITLKRGPKKSVVIPEGRKLDVAAIRIAKGMTQQELADKVGVIRQTISHIETGRITPSVPTAQAIAQVLGIDWTSFFVA